MPSTPLEVKLYTAASANAGLVALLGTSPFRWSSMQLTAGWTYPAIVTRQISGVPLNWNRGRNALSRYRVQFTIWEGYVPDTSNAVLEALRQFLDTFCATTTGNPGALIANMTDGLWAETQPGVYQTIIDYYIWNNDET